MPPGLPPVAIAASYDGVVRACVLAYKERGRRDLAPVLATALAAAVRELGPIGPLWLVPIPSVAAVARRRGGQHVRRLAERAARLLGARVVRALELTAGRPDTAELTAVERGVAAAGKFVARPDRFPDPGTKPVVVIVDDVVTTGSTIADAARALRAAGVRVAGAATVAGTQRETLGIQTTAKRYYPWLSHRQQHQVLCVVEGSWRVGGAQAG